MNNKPSCCEKCSKSQDYYLCSNVRCFCHTTPAPSVEGGWEIEFSKSFHEMKVVWDEKQQTYIWPETQVTSFIRTLLTQHDKKLVEKLEGMKKKQLEPYRESRDLGYNQALDDAIEIITKG